LGRVVDDDIDAGGLLERADVAALPPDDPAFHLIGGQAHDGDRALGRVVGRDALDREGDDVARLPLRFPARVLLDLADDLRRLGPRLFLHVLHELALGLFGGHPRELLEPVPRLLGELLVRGRLPLDVREPVLELALPFLELLLLLVEDVVLAVQARLALFQSPLDPLELFPAAGLLPLPLLFGAVGGLLALQLGSLADALRVLLRCPPDPRRLILGAGLGAPESETFRPPAHEPAERERPDGNGAGHDQAFHVLSENGRPRGRPRWASPLAASA